MTIVIKDKIMFSDMTSNENVNMSPSSTNDHCKFGFNYFAKVEKSNSYTKIPNQREYCYSHSKINKPEKYHTYGQPTWKQINQNHYLTKPYQFTTQLDEPPSKTSPNNDFTFLKKQNSTLKDKVGMLENQVVVKQSIIKHQKREIQDYKLAAIKWQRQPSPPLDVQLLSHIKTDKNKLYSHVVELQQEMKSLQDKYESIKEQHHQLQKNYEKVIASELPQKDELLEKKNKLLEFLQLELNKVKKQKREGQYDIREKKITKSLKEENEDLKEEVEGLKKRVKEFQEENQKISTKTASTNFVSMGDGSVVSPLHLDSTSQVEKLNLQIKKKNEMIKYLQYQCMRNTKSEELEKSKLQKQKLHDQCTATQKQLAKAARISEILKKESADIEGQLQKREQENECLKDKIKSLVYNSNKNQCQIENLQSKIKVYEQKMENINDQWITEHGKWETEKVYLGKKLSDALIKAEKAQNYFDQTIGELRQRYKEQSEEYKTLKQKETLLNSLSQKYNSLAKQYDHLLNERETYKTQIQEKDVLIIRLQNQISEFQQVMEMFKLSETSRIDNLQQEIKEKELVYVEKIEILERQKGQLRAQIIDNEKEIKNMEAQNLKSFQNIKDSEVKMKEQDIFLLQLQKDCVKKDQQILILKKQKEAAQKQKKQIQNSFQKSHSQVQSLEAKMKIHHNETKELQKFLKEKEQLIERNIKEIKKMQIEIKTQQDKHKKILSEVCAQKEGQKQIEKFEKNKMQEKIKQLDDQLNKIKIKNQNQDIQKQQLLAKMQALTEIIGTLNEKVQFLQDEKMKIFEQLSENKSGTKTESEQTSELKKNKQYEGEFLEIDKNALIYICELLNLQLEEGQMLKLIIKKLEEKNYDVKKSDYEQAYLEILQLFSIPVDSSFAHEKLIESFTSMVQKMKELENANLNLRSRLDQGRETQTRTHQIIHQLSTLLAHHNEEKMISMANHLSRKYKDEEI